MRGRTSTKRETLDPVERSDRNQPGIYIYIYINISQGKAAKSMKQQPQKEGGKRKKRVNKCAAIFLAAVNITYKDLRELGKKIDSVWQDE